MILVSYQLETKQQLKISKMNKKLILLIFALFLVVSESRRRVEDKKHCPKVKPINHFDLHKLLGKWYVIQYFATSEEALPYRCMRAEFTMSPHIVDVTMNFTYSFTDDPLNEQLMGNITWTIPNKKIPSHWTHSENIYEGVYNTFVLDSDYDSWALLLHCAEKSKSPRYLSSFIMSREAVLGVNVISYLRDKLPRYDIDLTYMFDMSQNDCDISQFELNIPQSLIPERKPIYIRKHPLKSHHK
ncbi:apolipoprotein D [Onthophagus taurus]|uniref:apolipoprotein D n=1 Tax=Onthophagus taurus TaxID=166361 RepID=UPI0039BEA8AE